MPAANPLTGGDVPGLSSNVYDVTGTQLTNETQAAVTDTGSGGRATSIHVAGLFVAAVVFLVVLRKNGFHDMIVS